MTERQRYEAELQVSEARFRDMADHAPMMVWVTDPTGYCTYLSQSWYDFSGQIEETGLGFGWLNATHPDDRAASRAIFLAANERQEAFQLEYRRRRQDGQYRTCIDAAKPWFGSDGTFKGYIGSVIDINDRIQTEVALRQSEERYRTLFESIDEGFCTIEVLFDDAGKALDYRFLEANPAFVRQTGLENAMGRTVRELVPQHEEFWFEIYGRIALTGEAQRFEHRAAALGRFYDVYAFRINNAAMRQVAILFNDISDRKQAEAALHDREQRLTIATEAALLGVFEWKVPEDVAIWENERMYEIFGHTRTEGAVSKQAFFENYIHPDDAETFAAQLLEAMQTGTLRQATCRIRRRDGTTI